MKREREAEARRVYQAWRQFQTYGKWADCPHPRDQITPDPVATHSFHYTLYVCGGCALTTTVMS